MFSNFQNLKIHPGLHCWGIPTIASCRYAVAKPHCVSRGACQHCAIDDFSKLPVIFLINLIMPLRFYNCTPNCLNKFNHVPRKKNSLTSASSFSNNVGVALTHRPIWPEVVWFCSHKYTHTGHSVWRFDRVLVIIGFGYILGCYFYANEP